MELAERLSEREYDIKNGISNAKVERKVEEEGVGIVGSQGLRSMVKNRSSTIYSALVLYKHLLNWINK